MSDHKYVRLPIGGNVEQLQDKIHRALEVAWRNGATDGSHHKMWTINQMIEALTGGHLDDFVELYEAELPDGDYYSWEEGVAP